MSNTELQYEKIEEEKFIRIHINKNEKFDFDFDIFLPKDLSKQEIERNLLVSFKEDGKEREEFMAETLKGPMMSIRVSSEDKSVDVSKFAQLAPESFSNNGYPYGESGLNMSEQYANAMKYAYSVLKSEGVLSKEHHERADIEGYSYNGVIAQRFALLHPEMVRSVIYGGAISSIPIPLTEYNGEILNYPAGIADIEKYTGKSSKQILEEYKSIVQVIYATENELRYDGNYTVDGKRVVRIEENEAGMPDFSTTLSSHDLSPDIVSVAVQQIRMFDETDINKRIKRVKELLENVEGNLRPIKIYGDTDHHSTNLETILDMAALIESLDIIEHQSGINFRNDSDDLIQMQGDVFRSNSDNINGFEQHMRGGKPVEIDVSFQSKREEVYERLRKGESAQEILQSMSLEDIQKYFKGGASEKPFVKTISSSTIEKVIYEKMHQIEEAQKIAMFHDQKSESAFEMIDAGIHTISKSDVVQVAKKDSVVSEKENAEGVIIKDSQIKEKDTQIKDEDSVKIL